MYNLMLEFLSIWQRYIYEHLYARRNLKLHSHVDWSVQLPIQKGFENWQLARPEGGFVVSTYWSAQLLIKKTYHILGYAYLWSLIKLQLLT